MQQSLHVSKLASGYVGKRTFDIFVSAILLLVFSPVLALTALLVRIKLGKPVLFKQARPGLHGKIFTIQKFRTMLDRQDSHGQQLSDEERLTPFGKFLRSTSMDELPELWNVLKGDMSLVGPRPMVAEYLPLYSPRQARRHDVLPGITGWTAVNGRNALSWDEKFELDVWYVEHIGLKLDLLILWRTFLGLFQRQGISAPGHATMPPFKGTE